jgi:integrase/recombinase XerD
MVVSGTRSLLRFLYLDGRIPLPLVSAVPGVAGWSMGPLPRAVSPEVAAALIASCDFDRRVGRRDHAILVLLARLGLRSQEVAEMELGDVDWRAGEVVIRGKGQRNERFPLPVDVGEAVVSYLQHSRPRCSSRRLFLSARAPLAPLSSSVIRSVVRYACRRAGVAAIGAHRLRHMVGTEALRAGASLAEVGQLLRHRSALTTANYAKVDRTALFALARPWPGAKP